MEHCRFRDCKHDREPGCAVRAAIEDGSLDPERFANLERLVAEEVALEDEQRAKVKTADRRRGGRPAPDGRGFCGVLESATTARCRGGSESDRAGGRWGWRRRRRRASIGP